MQSTQDSAPALPLYVDDAMADIAVIFHWPPEVMDRMDIHELMQWREHARIRSQVDKDK